MLLGSVVVADAVIALLWLPGSLLLWGGAVGAGVFCYLVIFVLRRRGGTIRKRLCAALLFAMGTFGAAWTGIAEPWRILSGPAAAFGILCFGNMELIEGWERRQSGARGGLWMLLLAAVCVVAGHSRWYGMIAAGAVGLAAVDRFGATLPREAGGVLADLALLTPLFFR